MKRRNGTSASTIRKEIEAAKLISPLRRNASTISGARLRASPVTPPIRPGYPGTGRLPPRETEAPDPDHVVEEKQKDD